MQNARVMRTIEASIQVSKKGLGGQTRCGRVRIPWAALKGNI
jgi:hypothetical protein